MQLFVNGDWLNLARVVPKTYVCGYCGDKVGPNQGYLANVEGQEILICSSCNCPTFISGNRQIPAPAFGADVEHVPDDIKSLYDEARYCMSVAAYTCAVLAPNVAIAYSRRTRGQARANVPGVR